MRERGSDFREAVRRFRQKQRRAELASDLRQGKQAAYLRSTFNVFLGDQGMVPAGALQAFHHLAHVSAGHGMKLECVEPVRRGHHIHHQDVRMAQALFAGERDGFFAEDVGGGDKADEQLLLIEHQQHAHAALDHVAIRLVHGHAGQSDRRRDAGQVRHDQQSRRIQRDRRLVLRRAAQMRAADKRFAKCQGRVVAHRRLHVCCRAGSHLLSCSRGRKGIGVFQAVQPGRRWRNRLRSLEWQRYTMDLQLSGKHVLVTGGSRGIGLACARAFLAEGARVSLIGRRRAHLDDAIAQLKAQGHVANGYDADLTDANAALAAVTAAWDATGPIDILVNSAGAALRTPFHELTPQDWQAAMQAKFFTYINVTDPLIKRMAERGTGAVVNIVGMGGKVATTTHLAGGAANAALMLASAGLAAAYGPRGVRVNAVNPGITRTERMQQGLEADARLSNTTPDQALAQISARLPLRRIATPDEIANAVVFLASPRAAYISGAVLSMDGAATPMVV